LTNDDGIHSSGLRALAESLTQLGDVFVVAPVSEQSGVGHGITFRVPLFAQKYFWDNGMTVWGVQGTPADCVRLGVLNIAEKKPDVVVSGMNLGLNLGINVIYSGTVAGAEEAALLGIDSFAASLEYTNAPPWKNGSEIVARLIRQILEQKTKDSAGLFNINVPVEACLSEQPVKVCVATVDMTPNLQSYEPRQDPYGGSYYWFSGKTVPKNPHLLTDRTAFKKGFVTVTPLDYNRTRRSELETMKTWFAGHEFFQTEISDFHDHQDSSLFVDGT